MRASQTDEGLHGTMVFVENRVYGKDLVPLRARDMNLVILLERAKLAVPLTRDSV